MEGPYPGNSTYLKEDEERKEESVTQLYKMEQRTIALGRTNRTGKANVD